MLKSLELFAQLLDFAPCGIGIFPFDSSIPLYLNKTFYKMIGYSEPEYKNLAAQPDYPLVYPPDFPILQAMIEDFETYGATNNREYRLVCKNGEKIWVKFNASKVTLENKDYAFATFVDISAEKKAIANLTLQKNKQELEHYRQERYRLLVEQTGAAVFEWNLQTEEFECSDAYYKYALSQVSPALILANEGPLEDVYPDDLPRLKKFFADCRDNSGKASAVLRLKMTDGSFRWTKMTGLFQKDIHGNVQRVIGSLTDIDEQEDKAIMLDGLINALPGGVAIIKIDPDLTWKYFSDGLARLSDRTHEEIAEMLKNKDTFYHTIFAEDAPRLLALLKEKSAKGETINSTFRYIAKNGEVRWSHLTANKIHDENGYPVYYAIFTKPADESLLYRNIVEDSTLGICVIEKASRRMIFCNSTWRRIENIPADIVVSGRYLFDLVGENKCILSEEQLAALPYDSYTSFQITRPGNLHYNVQGKSLIWNGIDSYIFYFLDQTVEIRQKNHLRKLLDNIPGGVGIYTYTDGKLILDYINNGYYHMIGSTRAERIQYVGQNILDYIHKDDVDSVRAALKTLLGNKNYLDISFRIPLSKGNYRWLRWVCAVVDRTASNDLTLYCSFSDINDLIKMQNALRNSHSVLDSALSAASVTAWELDIPARTMTKIQKAKDIFQASCVIKNVPSSLFDNSVIQIHPNSRSAMEKLCAEALAGKYATAEIYLRSLENKEKEFHWEKIIYTPILDISGKVLKSIGTALNITKRKQLEQNYEDRLALHKAVNKDTLGLAALNLNRNVVTETGGDSPVLKNLPSHITAQEMLSRISSVIPDTEEKQEFLTLFDFTHLRQCYRENRMHLSCCHRLAHRPGWIETSCELLNNPYSNELEAIFVARDVSREKQYEQVVNTLVTNDYDVIFVIDTNDSSLQLMRMAASSGTPLWSKDSKFSVKDIFSYLRRNCQESNVEEIIQQNSLSTIKKQLKNNALYTTNYSLIIQGKLCYKRMVYSYLGSDTRSILCAVQDYTESQRLEQQQKSTLENALREAKRAGAAKSDFLSDMSHEIRTPMNSIIGMTKLAQDEVLQNPQLALNYLDNIEASSIFLLGIINDILDMSRIESNKFELHYEWVLPSQLIDSVLSMIKPQMQKKGIHFYTSRPDSLSASTEFYVDVMRTKQILINLLNNACKFTPEGGTVHLEICLCHKEGSHAIDEIIVSDTGCGISSEFQKHIFEPFTQERNSQSSATQGTGLGLALVKKIITAMGGSVSLTSELNRGSTFTLKFPYEFRIRTAPTKTTEGIKADDAVLKGTCIMLAEDHPLNSLIATRLLEKKQIHVVPVSNGQQAVDNFLNSPTGTYDAILMDIRMPLMNGWDATKIIRNSPKADAKTVPILAMTANAFENDIQTSLQCGMNGHLSKPIEPEQLYACLATCIAQRKQ